MNEILLELKNLILEQNKRISLLEELTQTIIEEITKLKTEQQEIIKQTIKSTIQEEFAKILNQDKEKLFSKIDALKDKVNTNTLEELKEGINKLIEEFRNMKNDNDENHKKLLELGNELKEGFVELGEVLEIIQDSILEGQKGRSEVILENILAVFKQNATLQEKLDLLDKSLTNKFNIIFDVAKDTKDLVNRPRY